MKKATLVLGLLAASMSAAWAQSSVTMYGIVDAAVRKSSNANAGTAEKTLSSSGMSQSRLGFNINEDMGGGLRALANLEHRLGLDTGAINGTGAGVFWQQSWVGLQSADFGRVSLGRQYNVLFDLNATTFSSFKYSTYIDTYKPELGMTLGNRQDNMVKYALTAGPVTAELQVSAGEGGSALDKSAGGMIKYTSGAFAFGGGYLETTGTSVTAPTNVVGAKAKAAIIGAAYTSGPIYLNASWMQNKFSGPVAQRAALAGAYAAGFLGANQLNATALTDAKQRDMLMVGGTYQLTTQINLGAQYWHVNQERFTVGAADLKGDFLAFVADYAFSKRTDAYFEADRTNFKGGASYLNGATRRYNAMLGLRHRF